MDSAVRFFRAKPLVTPSSTHDAGRKFALLFALLSFTLTASVHGASLYVANAGTQIAPTPSVVIYDVDSNRMVTRRGSVPLAAGAPRELLRIASSLYVTSTSNEIIHFRIDQAGGLQRIKSYATGQDPVGIASDGTSLFVANSGSGTVSMFAIAGNGTGNLKPVRTVAAGPSPMFLAVHGKRKDILFVANGEGCTFRVKRQATLVPLVCPAPTLTLRAGRVLSDDGVLYSLASGLVNLPPPQTLTAVKALRVDPETGTWTLIGNELSFGSTTLYSLAASTSRRALFVARQGGIAVIPLASATAFGPAGTTLPVIGSPGALITDQSGAFLFATDPQQNRVVAMSVAAGGTLTTQSIADGQKINQQNAEFPTAIAFAP
jgi:6-phosphogluconolactonase (cycloisomerase 2 family)